MWVHFLVFPIILEEGRQTWGSESREMCRSDVLGTRSQADIKAWPGSGYIETQKLTDIRIQPLTSGLVSGYCQTSCRNDELTLIAKLRPPGQLAWSKVNKENRQLKETNPVKYPILIKYRNCWQQSRRMSSHKFFQVCPPSLCLKYFNFVPNTGQRRVTYPHTHIAVGNIIPPNIALQDILLSLLVIRQEVTDWCRTNLHWYYVAQCEDTGRWCQW